MEYSLPWDRTTLLWTLGTVALLAGLAGASLFWYRSALRAGTPAWPPLLAALVCLASLLPMAAVAPLGVRLSGPSLEVRRPIGAARYDLERVISAEVVPFGSVFAPGTWRSFGVGGPFGLIGSFRSPALGSFRAAVTRRADLVLVRFESGPPLVLSPDSPLELVEALRRARRLVPAPGGA